MEPSDEKILESVRDILKDADLNTISAKKVRKMLEEQFGVDLTERKASISTMTLDVVEELNAANQSEDEEQEESADESEEDEVEDVKPAVKRKRSTSSVSPAKRSKQSAPDSPLKRACAAKPKSRRVKRDEDGEEKKRSGGAYSKVLDLSPELAELMGADKMKRSDVVKQMWAIIRERNLKDPKDGRYHICDDQLFKVFGVKRVQTFGMLKYLKKHMT